jgi:hypothetical protein
LQGTGHLKKREFILRIEIDWAVEYLPSSRFNQKHWKKNMREKNKSLPFKQTEIRKAV